MSPKLPHLQPREVVGLLEKHGFEKERQVGSHAVYLHPDGRKPPFPYTAVGPSESDYSDKFSGTLKLIPNPEEVIEPECASLFEGTVRPDSLSLVSLIVGQGGTPTDRGAPPVS